MKHSRSTLHEGVDYSQYEASLKRCIGSLEQQISLREEIISLLDSALESRDDDTEHIIAQAAFLKKLRY